MHVRVRVMHFSLGTLIHKNENDQCMEDLFEFNLPPCVGKVVLPPISGSYVTQSPIFGTVNLKRLILLCVCIGVISNRIEERFKRGYWHFGCTYWQPMECMPAVRGGYSVCTSANIKRQ